MAEFNLHVSAEPDEFSKESVEALLSSYVESSESVRFTEESQSDAEAGTLESTLEIDGIDSFADVYTALRDSDESLEIGLWGPTAERFPVPVQHYALQQISMPDAYEFHAIDHKVTLVIADSQQLVQQLRQEVPPPALG